MRLRIIVSLPLVLLFVTIATSGQSPRTGNPQGTPSHLLVLRRPLVRIDAVRLSGPLQSNGSQPLVARTAKGHQVVEGIWSWTILS
jgi:hypothetical protein